MIDKKKPCNCLGCINHNDECIRDIRAKSAGGADPAAEYDGTAYDIGQAINVVARFTEEKQANMQRQLFASQEAERLEDEHAEAVESLQAALLGEGQPLERAVLVEGEPPRVMILGAGIAPRVLPLEPAFDAIPF